MFQFSNEESPLACYLSYSFVFSEHSAPLDVEISNKKFLTRTEELWDTLEASNWYLHDSDAGETPQKLANGTAADEK